MSERYTISNRPGSKSKTTTPKTKAAKGSTALETPSLPAVYWIIIIGVLVVATNVATYFITSAVLSKRITDSQNKAAELQKKLTQAQTNPTNSKSPGGDGGASVPQDLRNKIQAAIDAKNYQALASLLGKNVTFTKAGSSTAQQTPEQVIASLGYLNGANGAWNWNVSPALLTQLQQGSNAQYFGPGAIIGQSSNGYVVAITVNSSGQVTNVFVSPTPQDAGATSTVTGEGSE
jgi:hypothetical protein